MPAFATHACAHSTEHQLLTSAGSYAKEMKKASSAYVQAAIDAASNKIITAKAIIGEQQVCLTMFVNPCCIAYRC